MLILWFAVYLQTCTKDIKYINSMDGYNLEHILIMFSFHKLTKIKALSLSKALSFVKRFKESFSSSTIIFENNIYRLFENVFKIQWFSVSYSFKIKFIIIIV